MPDDEHAAIPADEHAAIPADGRQPRRGRSRLTRPFGIGSSGDHVRDLQRRLSALADSEPCPLTGVFDETTRRALESFQNDRAMDVDGIVGTDTWQALVEAGVRLGDRPLYLTSPQLRGDDVADLQQMLSTLGFGSGRIDGILGNRTALSLVEFQVNAGLSGDGVCGPRTITALARLLRPLPRGRAVAHIQERRRMGVRADVGDSVAGALADVASDGRSNGDPDAPAAGRRIAVGEPGGLGIVVAALRRCLLRAGADVLPLCHPSWSAQAAQANEFGADVYVACELRPAPPSVSYFKGRHFTSELGRRLADKTAECLEPVVGPVERCGRSFPMLRESQMPAVLVRLDDAAAAAEHARSIADAAGAAVVDLLTGVDLTSPSDSRAEL
ncbi:MAG TPA: hypothetical protein DEP66_04900 [Acidimicrobiaceae bacterium]|nr:hypothetical protein [Acidimicrobiaceae bacterium]HCB37536.1 hypothetical protein [Acidimicrobiaceae bacterium]